MRAGAYGKYEHDILRRPRFRLTCLSENRRSCKLPFSGHSVCPVFVGLDNLALV